MSDEKLYAGAIPPDDLSAGTYVTVLKGMMCDERVPVGTGIFGLPDYQRTGETFEDRSFQGDVLKIEAVDLPFLVVSFPARKGTHRWQFDIRRGWQFKRLSDEYVAARCPNHAEKAIEEPK